MSLQIFVHFRTILLHKNDLSRNEASNTIMNIPQRKPQTTELTAKSLQPLY